MTSVSKKVIQFGGGEDGEGGMGDCGYLASISSKFSVESGATPSEIRAWIAFLYWPASIARFARLPLDVLTNFHEMASCGFCDTWLDSLHWPGGPTKGL